MKNVLVAITFFISLMVMGSEGPLFPYINLVGLGMFYLSTKGMRNGRTTYR